MEEPGSSRRLPVGHPFPMSRRTTFLLIVLWPILALLLLG
jgi:nitrate reductase NapE component